jgi:hypothetical protein
LQEVLKEKSVSVSEMMEKLFSFSLSDKFKFAFKASLSVMLAYLIPLSQGWEQISTAATTVMLIAAMGSVGDSVMKGMLRVIGTLIGAVIGMFLIALFPQERELYLLAASLIVTVMLYFARAYKGDMTIFLLSAITLMSMFQNGEVDNVFLYGINKTYMTVFGIAVYTFVGIFLWPVHVKDESIENVLLLTKMQADYYSHPQQKMHQKAYRDLLEKEALLASSVTRTGNAATEKGLNRPQWESIVNDYKKINALLTLLSYQTETSLQKNIKYYIGNYDRIREETDTLFVQIAKAWESKSPIDIPDALEAEYHIAQMQRLSQFQIASLTSYVENMLRLHAKLCQLAQKLNAFNSPSPTKFKRERTVKSPSFLWFDIEDLKGTLLSFLIFWTGALSWIVLNPPGGFLIVTFATGLSLITTFTPVKPSLMIIVFSFAFVFAALMYIGVLPHLVYGVELGVFIFLYAFIGFYFINPQISIFFLLGMLTLNISNTMSYNFDIFLSTLLVFYCFLFLLLLFYYIPFSTKPESLFLTMHKRFFRLSYILLDYLHRRSRQESSLLSKLAVKYSKIHLKSTVKKMQFWAGHIDESYFSPLKKEELLAYAAACEKFAYLLEILFSKEEKVIENPLIVNFKKSDDTYPLIALLEKYAKGEDLLLSDPKMENESSLLTGLEEKLKTAFKKETIAHYSKEELIVFYETISLNIHLWFAFLSCLKHLKKIDMRLLERSRF